MNPDYIVVVEHPDPSMVIVEKQEPDVVVVSEGVKGRKGDKGDKGDVGPAGPIGLSGLPLKVITNRDSVLNVSVEDNATLFIIDAVESTEYDIYFYPAGEDEDEENPVGLGSVILFCSLWPTPINLNPDDAVTLLVPDGCLPKPHSVNSTIGVVYVSKNTWLLTGDLALSDVVENDI